MACNWNDTDSKNIKKARSSIGKDASSSGMKERFDSSTGYKNRTFSSAG